MTVVIYTQDVVSSMKKGVSRMTMQKPTTVTFPRVSLPNLSSFFNDDGWNLGEAIFGERDLSVSEDDDEIVVEAHLPGLSEDDIDITYERGVVWIRGTAKEEETKRTYYRKASREYSYRVTVPEGARDDDPKAQYKDGVVRLTFAKDEDMAPRKISLSS